ncbi:MAG: ABC transporter permease [Candidatus Lambdaproteobacteria bacterium]|nr:ABC transporter permease [Candidatus Lambdaproteobacteria bacterium]
MRLEWAIGLRYLRSRRSEGAISLISLFATMGVALGVAALVVAMAVMNGYQTNLVRAMAGSLPHVSLFPSQGRVFKDRERVIRALGPLVAPVTVGAFALQEALVQRVGSGAAPVQGVMLRGIEPAAERQERSFLAFLDDGRADWAGLPLASRLERADALLAGLGQPAADGAVAVLLSRVLARKLGVALGGVLQPLEFPRAGGFAPVPLHQRLRVVGHFESGIMAFDELVLLLHVGQLERVVGAERAEEGLGLRLQHPLAAAEAAATLRRASPIGADNFYVYSWIETNRGLFQVIRTQKVMLYLVLMLIVVIAFFGMISALILLVSEKNREIAILKSLGARDRTIRDVFILQGVLIGAVGTALGLALGLAVCWGLFTFPLIEIPPGVYPGSDRVPVRVALADLLWIVGGTMAVCGAATLYPARRATVLRPVQGLRAE